MLLLALQHLRCVPSCMPAMIGIAKALPPRERSSGCSRSRCSNSSSSLMITCAWYATMQEALQELQQLQLAAPQLHSPAATHGEVQQHHHSQPDRQLVCAADPPAVQQDPQGNPAASIALWAPQSSDELSQQPGTASPPSPQQQHSQPQLPSVVAAVPAKQGQADVQLTPLQAAQRAFLEEQQRLHKVRGPLSLLQLCLQQCSVRPRSNATQ